MDSKFLEHLHEEAKLAREFSHSPYSRFAVGAALKLKGSDKIIRGCNIENASIGATICAERVALVKLRSEDKKPQIEALMIVTAEAKATAPCGICLQSLAEFCGPDLKIYLASLSGVIEKLQFKDLLPRAFRSFESSQ